MLQVQGHYLIYSKVLHMYFTPAFKTIIRPRCDGSQTTLLQWKLHISNMWIKNFFVLMFIRTICIMCKVLCNILNAHATCSPRETQQRTQVHLKVLVGTYIYCTPKSELASKHNIRKSTLIVWYHGSRVLWPLLKEKRYISQKRGVKLSNILTIKLTSVLLVYRHTYYTSSIHTLRLHVRD